MASGPPVVFGASREDTEDNAGGGADMEDNAGGGAESQAADEALPDAHGLLLVFGASGGTGVLLLQQALERGYSVRAFVRSRLTLEREIGDLIDHELLEIREGDLLDAPAVEAAVAGTRAVISVAGAKPETAPGPMAEAVPAMVEGCRKHGVRKLIVQTCASSPLPTERVGWLTQQTLVRIVVRWQLGSSVVDDNDRVIQFLTQNVRDLDWVVSRPPGLMDGDPLGPLTPCMDEFKTAPVRYADVAAWTLAQVESNTYAGKAPRLYYAPVTNPL